MTNANRIRGLSDLALAKEFVQFYQGSAFNAPKYFTQHCEEVFCDEESAILKEYQYLTQEVNEKETKTKEEQEKQNKIDKKDFIKIIEKLEAEHELEDDVDDLIRRSREIIQNDFMNAYSFTILNENIIIDLLGILLGEEIKEIIEWWIYETNFGKKGITKICNKGGSITMDIKTADDLWSFITSI